MANYHAIGEYVCNQEGRMLHTAHRYTNLYISASLLGQHPGGYPELELYPSFELAKTLRIKLQSQLNDK
jgi:hypothetical protein